MKENELKVFLDGLVHYYNQTTDTEVEVEAPYLIDDINSNLSDYTGRIEISGGYKGNVLFTAPHRMLVALLARYGQKGSDVSYLLDLVGEIANTIAGNARESLGSKFNLSTPSVTRGNSLELKTEAGLKTYCVPVKWNKQKAKLIIAVS